jgi:hypothetical protein
MKRTHPAWIAATLTLISACAPMVAPVAVTGPPADLAALVGEWAGTYGYDGGRHRSGSILFRLASAGEAAEGDVLMMFQGPEPGPIVLPVEGERWSVTRPGDQLLSISFVRTAGGTVTGALEPYTDPTCGCTLVTTFRGRVAGDEIEGTFMARRADGGNAEEGRWKVTRRR